VTDTNSFLMINLIVKTVNNCLNKLYQALNFLGFLLVIILNFLFIYLVYDISFNVPYFDDFDAIGSFILNSENKSLSTIIHDIFSQYAEHRIGFTRFISLTYFKLFGFVNFKHLILFGLCGLIGIQFLIYFQIRHLKYRFFLLSSCSAILLNFQYWENMMSAMTSLQNLFAPFFCLLGIYLLSKGSILKFRITAYFVIFLAIFTSGNGLLILPIGLLYIIITKENRGNFLMWIVFSFIMLFIYFFGYENPPEVFGGRSNKLQIITLPFLFVKNYTLFLTSTLASVGISFNTCILLGIGLTIYIIFYCGRTFLTSGHNVNHGYFYVLVFAYLIGVSFMVAVNRGSHLENMLFSRYKIYSTLFIIFVFLSFIELLRVNWLIWIYSIFSFFFFYSSLPFISNLFNHFNELKYSCMTYYINSSNWKGTYPPFTTHFTNAQTASIISQRMARSGFYNVPVFAEMNQVLRNSKGNNISFDCGENKQNVFPSHIKIDFTGKSINIKENNYFEMKSNKCVGLFPLKYNFSNMDIFKKIVGLPIYVSSFTIIIPKSNIDHGVYEVKLNTSKSVSTCKIMDLNVPFQSSLQSHN
jgi:hypothetical protein